MSCMKCGKDTENGQAFCARCLGSMEAYPIKPDVHIQLPVRATKESAKKPPRKSRTTRQKTQATSLRKQIRWMWVVIVLLVLALAASMGRDVVIPEYKEPGKNYTYTEPTT